MYIMDLEIAASKEGNSYIVHEDRIILWSVDSDVAEALMDSKDPIPIFNNWVEDIFVSERISFTYKHHVSDVSDWIDDYKNQGFEIKFIPH